MVWYNPGDHSAGVNKDVIVSLKKSYSDSTGFRLRVGHSQVNDIGLTVAWAPNDYQTRKTSANALDINEWAYVAAAYDGVAG